MAEIECRPLAQAIRAHVLSVWKECEGNQKAAAASLCISVPKLRNYLASYGIGTTTDKAKESAHRTRAPGDLSRTQYESLLRWVDAKEPWARSRVVAIVDHCLEWHRGAGSLKADWVATCRTWIKNMVARDPSLRSAAPAPAHKARPVEKASPGAVQALNALLNGESSRRRMP